MTFGQSIKTVFSKYATFSGRASRSEYWWFVLLNAIMGFIPVINFIWGLAVIVPTIAVAVRRMHDIGKSGFMVILSIIPLVNLFYLYLTICDSQAEANEYGAKP